MTASASCGAATAVAADASGPRLRVTVTESL